jgi:PAS domain-containing protein
MNTEAAEAADRGRREEPPEHPLELILARNLISIISVPAILVDAEGRFVFFNEAAGELIGAPFEEVGVLEPEDWNARYGPFNGNGQQLPREELPLATAVRESRPAYGRFFVRAGTQMREVEAGALPLMGPAGYHGAVILVWPVAPPEGG